ncbi:MAG: ankyrin repeat domain-containing protein, partial [Cyanobacteria bacterium J06635_15]
TTLVPLLEPVFLHDVPPETLQAIQANFHAVMIERAGDLLIKARFRLPKLSVLLELPDPGMYCSIPDMYGGFRYWFSETGTNAMLMTESWCRVVDGSGRRHQVTAHGSQLMDQGFV